MKTRMLLYPGFTTLDAIGPYHALAAIPDWDFGFVARERGPVSDGGKVTLEAQYGIDDVDACDLLVVPGGVAAIVMARSGDPICEWIAAVHPTTTWTASVCTGSLLLGAAGVLKGKRATSHWYVRDELAAFGAVPVDERVVIDGNIATAAGVSAGIDLSLTLAERIAGTRHAQAAQLDMEYNPAPPLDAGHPSTAPADVVDWLRGMYDQMLNGAPSAAE